MSEWTKIMTAFDAKTAKPGSMWLTRGGEKVEFVAYAERAKADRQAIFVGQDGEIYNNYADGHYYHGDDHFRDIISPAPATVTLPECWLVQCMTHGAWSSCTYTSEVYAKAHAKRFRGHITHIPAREVPADEVEK